MSITVTATERGFYGQLREPGEVFEVKSSEDLGKWMERADKKDAQDAARAEQQTGQAARERGAQRRGTPAGSDDPLA